MSSWTTYQAAAYWCATRSTIGETIGTGTPGAQKSISTGIEARDVLCEGRRVGVDDPRQRLVAVPAAAARPPPTAADAVLLAQLGHVNIVGARHQVVCPGGARRRGGACGPARYEGGGGR